MASQNSCNSAYLAVPQDELSQPLKPYLIKKIYDEVDEDLPVTSFSSRLRQRIFQNRMHWATHFLLSLMLMLSIITPAFPGFAKENNRGHLIRPAEEFYQDITQLSETKPSYLGKKTRLSKDQEKWKGRPNEENDRLWRALGDVGLVSITETEARHLGVRTARNIRVPDEFVIAPLVYHELHCLSMYRDLLWKVVDNTVEINAEMEEHHDHCIHTLRQSLMCNANLSPLTFLWKDYKIDYLPTWNAPMQCRNWDSIQNWASARNTSGMHTTIRADAEETKRRIQELKTQGGKMPWEYLF